MSSHILHPIKLLSGHGKLCSAHYLNQLQMILFMALLNTQF